MTITRWLRSALATPTRPPARHLAVERLEDRLTPSTGGVLDPTFGTGGHVLSSFTNNNDQAQAVTVQPDGKIVVAGKTETSGSRTLFDFLVARYNADGTLDTAFGTGGRTVTDFNRGYDYAEAVALQPQASGPAKILAAGMSMNNGNDNFAVARYNANGTLDTTFGSKSDKGKVTTDLGGSLDWGQSMVVDSAGRILVAGYTNAPGVGYTAALVRYTANGALDTTFGNGGKLITSINYVHVVGSGGVAVALHADGKIVIASKTIDPVTGTYAVVVARFTSDGTADQSFGSGGSVVSPPTFDGGFGGVAIQGDGKIVVSESVNDNNAASDNLGLLRYNGDGTLDTGFGTGGIVTLPPPGGPSSGTINPNGIGPVIQSDGEIIAGGQYYDTTAQQEILAAVRVNPGGTVDTGYGDGGWATVQFASNDSLDAIALQPDGRLLLAGSARPTSTGPTDVALVRFLGSAPQVGSFTASSNPVTAGSAVTLTASNLTDGNPNSSITHLAFYLDSNGDGILEPGTDTLLGHGTQSNGTWALTFSTADWAAAIDTLFAQAQDSYGVFGDPLALTLQVL